MVSDSNNRILIIDDMESIHDCFRKILAPAKKPLYTDLDQMNKILFGIVEENKVTPSFELDFAYQGDEGLKLVKKSKERNTPYALAFIDVQMPPGDDGITTVEKIWKEDSSIQIIICSAYAKYTWDEIIQRLGDSDSFFLLKKPFDSIEVQQLAKALTKKWTLNKTIKENTRSGAPSTLTETSEALAAINQQLRQNFPKS